MSTNVISFVDEENPGDLIEKIREYKDKDEMAQVIVDAAELNDSEITRLGAAISNSDVDSLHVLIRGQRKGEKVKLLFDVLTKLRCNRLRNITFEGCAHEAADSLRLYFEFQDAPGKNSHRVESLSFIALDGEEQNWGNYASFLRSLNAMTELRIDGSLTGVLSLCDIWSHPPKRFRSRPGNGEDANGLIQILCKHVTKVQKSDLPISSPENCEVLTKEPVNFEEFHLEMSSADIDITTYATILDYVSRVRNMKKLSVSILADYIDLDCIYKKLQRTVLKSDSIRSLCVCDGKESLNRRISYLLHICHHTLLELVLKLSSFGDDEDEDETFDCGFLTHLLSHNSSLETLNLEHCPLRDSEMNRLLDLIPSMKNINSLTLPTDFMDTDHLIKVLATARDTPSLTHVKYDFEGKGFLEHAVGAAKDESVRSLNVDIGWPDLVRDEVMRYLNDDSCPAEAKAMLPRIIVDLAISDCLKLNRMRKSEFLATANLAFYPFVFEHLRSSSMPSAMYYMLREKHDVLIPSRVDDRTQSSKSVNANEPSTVGAGNKRKRYKK